MKLKFQKIFLLSGVSKSMTKPIRLGWEPENMVPHKLIEDRLLEYTNRRKRFVLMENGTAVFLSDYGNIESDISECMEGLSFIPDFSVRKMTHKDFLVDISGFAYVYVGREEFDGVRDEIIQRGRELLFPGESFLSAEAQDDFLVGIYARGKIYRDEFGNKIKYIVEP